MFFFKSEVFKRLRRASRQQLAKLRPRITHFRPKVTNTLKIQSKMNYFFQKRGLQAPAAFLPTTSKKYGSKNRWRWIKMSVKIGRNVGEDGSKNRWRWVEKSLKIGRNFVEDGSRFRRRWLQNPSKRGRNLIENGSIWFRKRVEFWPKIRPEELEKWSESGRKVVKEGSAAEAVRPSK